MTSGPTPPPTESTSSAPIPRRRHPLVHFWTYTLLRVALFGVLFVILWVSGLVGLLAAAIALALSVPLSYVLLARPREALAEEMRLRVTERQARGHSLDADLAGPSADVNVVQEDGSSAGTEREQPDPADVAEPDRSRSARAGRRTKSRDPAAPPPEPS
ncbi:MAG: DUF4229 domain-containing protein [bacterium]